MMFSGFSAFPLTPFNAAGVDEAAFARLVQRLVEAGVDSIGALGSTGLYPYLSREERARVTRLAVQNAGALPVMVGIGALLMRDVLLLAEDAQQAGASALLLAPVSYHRLNDEEVYGLFEAVSRHVGVPLCVYDNPGTTRFDFSDELHGRIAQLPNIASIKIPGVPAAPVAAAERVARLRALIPAHVRIGISGDRFAAAGLGAGCALWYSALGGVLPRTMMAISRAALAGDAALAAELSARLQPLWDLCIKYNGGLRVAASVAELIGLTHSPSLPAPLKGIASDDRALLAGLIDTLELA